MTNNTIPNVPRELLERLHSYIPNGDGHNSQYANDLADAVVALEGFAAPSPAGVDGLEVQLVKHLNTRRVCYMCAQLPRNEVCGLCDEASSDAQAIIDGLRGEVERSKQFAAGHVLTNERISASLHAVEAERDQQAQRIGELELALNAIADCTSDDTARDCAMRALSAGKEGE